MTLVYFFVELLFLLCGTIGFVMSQNCINVTIQQDKYMEHQVFRKLLGHSLYDCASECRMSSVCLSFSFEDETSTCFLNSNSSVDESISPRSGFIFSDIQSWPKALSGPCSVMSCPVTTSCQVDRHGRATCVPEFTGCGHPPDVPRANKTYDGHYQGAVVRYTCKEDYTVCHQRNTSVCQASGQWETVTDLCGKFKWRNPRVHIEYDLPCGPQSQFNVLLQATPTTATRIPFTEGEMRKIISEKPAKSSDLDPMPALLLTSVFLRVGEDCAFLVDFRFNHLTTKNKTIINSKFLNRWGTELEYPLPLTVGKESKIQIFLQSGVYKVVVDNIVLIIFPERRSGIQPDRVYLGGACVVRVMEILI